MATKQVTIRLYGDIETILPCATQVGGFVNFTVEGITGLDEIITEVVTPWSAVTSRVTLQYDDSDLPAGVSLVEGNLVCPVCEDDNCCTIHTYVSGTADGPNDPANLPSAAELARPGQHIMMHSVIEDTNTVEPSAAWRYLGADHPDYPGKWMKYPS